MGPAGLAAHIPRGTNHVGASRCGNTSAVMERARWIVGTIGVPTLGAGIVATFMHEPAVADAAMIFTGGGMTIIAALQPVLSSLKLGKSGIEVHLREGEEDAAAGRVIEMGKAVEAVETALSGSSEVTVDVQVHADGVVTPGNIVLTSSAMGQLAGLSSEDRAAVETALRTLDGTDPSLGNAYHVRSVQPGVMIFYRPMEKTSPDDPDKWVVLFLRNLRPPRYLRDLRLGDG
jgi:hypothetical protein